MFMNKSAIKIEQALKNPSLELEAMIHFLATFTKAYAIRIFLSELTVIYHTEICFAFTLQSFYLRWKLLTVRTLQT